MIQDDFIGMNDHDNTLFDDIHTLELIMNWLDVYQMNWQDCIYQNKIRKYINWKIQPTGENTRLNMKAITKGNMKLIWWYKSIIHKVII